MHDFLLPFYKAIDPILLVYFSLINLIYTIFFILGMFGTYKRMKELHVEDYTHILQSNFLPEITFIVPAYNESQVIISCVDNLRNLTYPYKKIIVVNDGSTDSTFNVLFEQLKLSSIPIYFHEVLPSKPIKGVYQSTLYPNVLVIDKENGEKFDALNAAINACTTAYFTVMDSDTYIEDSEFETLIRPLFSSANTIAVGASVKIKNGCPVLWNRIETKTFPKDYIAGVQAIEYLRTFLLRTGWDYINETFIISGAFGVFLKEAIVKVGGYGPTIANDMEIILRLNRMMTATKTPYHIAYLPDTVAWTDGPATWKALEDQRIRWQRGTLESLWFHKKVMFNPKYGFKGFFVHPFLVFLEAFEPLVEIFGYLYILIGWIFGIVNPFFVFSFIALTLGFVFIQTLVSLMVEEFSFRKFTSLRTIFILFLFSLFETLGYRQLTLFWRAKGFSSFYKRFKKIQEDSKRLNSEIDRIVKNGPIKW